MNSKINWFSVLDQYLIDPAWYFGASNLFPKSKPEGWPRLDKGSSKRSFLPNGSLTPWANPNPFPRLLSWLIKEPNAGFNAWVPKEWLPWLEGKLANGELSPCPNPWLRPSPMPGLSPCPKLSPWPIPWPRPCPNPRFTWTWRLVKFPQSFFPFGT